mgnify:CR=1 FL=1
MKRQRAKQRPLYRYDVYRGRRRGQARLIGAAGCAVFGLLLVLIRSLGIRFSGFLLLGLAALLELSWLLDRLVFIIARGGSDMTPLPADAVIVLGAGVNGTEPSLSLRTRLDKAVDYLERWPDIPAVLTGGTGYGEEISEAQCMYDYLTEYGVEADRLILEDRASNTAENFAFSWELLTEAGVDPAEGRVAVVTNDFHIARAELIAAREGYGDVAGIPAPLPWVHLEINYTLREAFAMVKTFLFD